MTTVADALAAVYRLGFDTSPFIYLIERHPQYVDRVRQVFSRIDSGTMLGFSSVLTLTEVLTQPIQHGNDVVQAEYRAFLLGSRNLSLADITAAIAENAALLRARHRLRTPDALQIDTALELNCDAFVTNDTGLRRVTELPIIVIDDLTT